MRGRRTGGGGSEELPHYRYVRRQREWSLSHFGLIYTIDTIDFDLFGLCKAGLELGLHNPYSRVCRFDLCRSFSNNLTFCIFVAGKHDVWRICVV